MLERRSPLRATRGRSYDYGYAGRCYDVCDRRRSWSGRPSAWLLVASMVVLWPETRRYRKRYGTSWRRLRERGLEDPKVLDVAPGQPRLIRGLLEAAGDPDREFLLRAEEGLPLGILEPLPRTPHIFEEQVKWPLDNSPWEPAPSWVPNYHSVKDHESYVREKFEEDVAEGLMERMSLREFQERYGEGRAIAALAVIVEDETTGKKRVIHDASHGVRVNHRIKCRDKIRAPGAREKKTLLREMRAKKKTAFSVVGDISKAHRRYKHQASEHGFMGCQVDDKEELEGDPGSQSVYVNKVGTFGLPRELLVDAHCRVWLEAHAPLDGAGL